MRSHRSRMFPLLVLGGSVVFAAIAAGQARAGEPVPRLFAEVTDPTLPCVEWEAEESRRIVAGPGGGDVIRFITPVDGVWFDDDAMVRDDEGNVLLDLRSTSWVQMPVMHVTESGVEQIRHVYWLLEDLDGDGDVDPPSAGMTAATGPEGQVLGFVEIRLARVGTSDSFGNANKFYITPNGTHKFCIAIGRFQK